MVGQRGSTGKEHALRALIQGRFLDQLFCCFQVSLPDHDLDLAQSVGGEGMNGLDDQTFQQAWDTMAGQQAFNNLGLYRALHGDKLF